MKIERLIDVMRSREDMSSHDQELTAASRLGGDGRGTLWMNHVNPFNFDISSTLKDRHDLI